MVSLTGETHDSAILHSWFDLNFFLNEDIFFGLAITQSRHLGKLKRLSASVEELLEGASAADAKVFCVRLTLIRNCVLVKVRLNLLDHLNLLAGVVECDGVWVTRPEEDLKHLERVSIEGVPTDLAFSVCVRSKRKHS